MSSDVEPIAPPWREGQHCRHCHPQCDGRYDPHDGGVYHEVGEAFTWHPEYGCPVCRIVALLREMAAEAEADAAIWHEFAAEMDEHGHHAGAEADRDEARIQKRVMQAILEAADRIDNSEGMRSEHI